jgi:hypothetical protein
MQGLEGSGLSRAWALALPSPHLPARLGGQSEARRSSASHPLTKLGSAKADGTNRSVFVRRTVDVIDGDGLTVNDDGLARTAHLA